MLCLPSWKRVLISEKAVLFLFLFQPVADFFDPSGVKIST